MQDAALQAAIACRAILGEEEHYSKTLGDTGTAGSRGTPVPWQTQLVIPVVITSARLYVCDFDPLDVNKDTGEVPRERASLARHDLIVFEYPLPKHLQTAPKDLATALREDRMEWFSRLHVLVVHSAYLRQFLESLSGTGLTGITGQAT